MEKKEVFLESGENRNQTAEYFAIVSVGTEMRLWICEGLHRSMCMVIQSRMRGLGGLSVVRLMKVHLYSLIVVDGNIFHAWHAWSNGDMDDISTVDTGRYHFHFLKKSYFLLDAIHFVHDFKPGF